LNSTEDKVRLYELTLANGRSSRPYVWRVRYALAHKGVTVNPVPVGFTEIASVFAGRFKTLPVLEHGDTMVRFLDAWYSAEILRKMFGIYALDVHDAARPDDRD
jgi:glutathione S-transferase